MATNDLKDVVREKYGQAASLVQKGRTSCCGTASSVANWSAGRALTSIMVTAWPA